MDYSLERVEGRHVVGVGFACDLDDVLRVLDDGSMSRLVNDMCRVLDTVGRGDSMAWGSHHIAYSFTLTDPPVDLQEGYTALSWYGWINPSWTLPAYDTWEGDNTWPTLDAQLQQLSLPLRIVVSDIRGCVAVGPDGNVLLARGPTPAAEFLADALVQDPSDWTGSHALDEGQPWREVAAAISTRDGTKIGVALKSALDSYTTIGFRVVCEGFMRYLVQWLPEHQP